MKPLRISLLINIVLMLALVSVLRNRTEQVKSLDNLRAQLGSVSTLAGVEPDRATSEAEVLILQPTSGPITVATVAVASTTSVDNAPSIDGEPETLRRDTEELLTRVKELEAELARAKEVAPDLVVAADAYFGPGTWLNVNPQTFGITKIVIAAQPPDVRTPRMTISAWGRCTPIDCEWGEVEFLVLVNSAPPAGRRRGFAAWEQENWIKYAVLTFEKAALKVDCISIAKQPQRSHRFFTEGMTRFN